jgi:hypothetical protein
VPRIAQPRLSAPPARRFSLEGQSRSDAFAALDQPGDWACFGGFTLQGGDLFDDERLRVAIGRASRVHRRSLTDRIQQGRCRHAGAAPGGRATRAVQPLEFGDATSHPGHAHNNERCGQVHSSYGWRTFMEYASGEVRDAGRDHVASTPAPWHGL